MKGTFVRIFVGLLVLFGFALVTAQVQAQSTFIYTNNNVNGGNSVSAFSVGDGGALNSIGTFATGGLGTGDGFRASNRITITRNFLYASNEGSDTISAFSIDPSTGVLTANVPGSPFATGGSGPAGISLAATRNGKFLYAGNSNSNNISAFRIGSNGALTPVTGSPFAAGNSPDGIKVSPDGRFLAVALPFPPSSPPDFGKGGSVAMFSIDPSTGALSSVNGSPFAQGAGGNTGYVDFSCQSNRLFASHFNADNAHPFGISTIVSVASIASDGALTQITKSPFTFGPGANSNVGVLSADNKHLFVSNQGSNTITSLDVASEGSLTQEEVGSPFANPGANGNEPTGMVTNREGTLLYVANTNRNTNNENAVSGFHIDSDGGLSPVMNSPFPTGVAGNLRSLTVFQAKRVEGEGSEKSDDGHEGSFQFTAASECEPSGEMQFEENSGASSQAMRGSMTTAILGGNQGQAMKGSMSAAILGANQGQAMRGKIDAISVSGNQAIITGSGTLLDGTPLQYTAVVLGNAPFIGGNQFAISWITATGSFFLTSGALTDGYIMVNP